MQTYFKFGLTRRLANNIYEFLVLNVVFPFCYLFTSIVIIAKGSAMFILISFNRNNGQYRVHTVEKNWISKKEKIVAHLFAKFKSTLPYGLSIFIYERFWIFYKTDCIKLIVFIYYLEFLWFNIEYFWVLDDITAFLYTIQFSV